MSTMSPMLCKQWKPVHTYTHIFFPNYFIEKRIVRILHTSNSLPVENNTYSEKSVQTEGRDFKYEADLVGGSVQKACALIFFL